MTRKNAFRSGMFGLVVSVFVATGCQSSLTTEITVMEDGAEVVASLSFQGDVAKVLQKDQVLREQLEDKLAELVDDFSVESPGGLYILNPSQTELQAASSITGIGPIVIARSGSVATVTVQTVDPVQLREAILAAVGSQPDAQALQQTMLSNTFLEVRITFPGNVVEYNGGVVEGRSVRYKDSIESWAAGTLVARGGTDESIDPMWMIVAALAGVGVVVYAWRRTKR